MHRYLWVASFIFFALFAMLLVIVATSPDVITPLDAFVHALVVPLQTPMWSAVFLQISNFGGTYGIIAGIGIVTIYYRHRPDIITRLYFAITASTISNEYLKNMVARSRPPLLSWLHPIHSYSFPSGHAQASTVFYGFLAILLFVHASTKARKVFAITAPAFFIFIVGISRVILNAHYASDVLGGWVLGGFWLTFSLSVPLYYALYHQEVIHTEPIERPLL